ncbi:glycosyltransferase family 4 protein [Salinibacter ruber]|uniref:glycosyltransferase family 4 protein n=1 Tax=Salinibacter ruber TaxID=146919 RepID=UPI002072FF0B|nr:glycosyltransferase family 4 protein [Salinibacter ruber]
MRITVLYSRLTGYVEACLKALATYEDDIRLQVFRWPASDNAPFDPATFDWIDELSVKKGQSTQELETAVRSFSPDAILMSGWIDSEYLSVARAFESPHVPVVAGCDTQWTGDLRQQAGRLLAPWYLHSAIDVLWVPGERQRRLAAKLGYTGRDCWSGYYACDWPNFAPIHDRASPVDPAFLFVGRYVEEKGADVLVEAYRQYRRSVADPWPLVTAGAGPLEDALEDTTGIDNRGFVQPDALPELMGSAAAFVLPSRFEPWGVVVQEAAAAGLPVLCSTASGAGVHLVQDGYNGFQVESGSVSHLTHAMRRMGALSPEERKRMGERGHELSKQYTPERWAETFVEGVKQHKRQEATA